MTTTPTDPHPETELVPTDDTIIGTAFRWSLLFIVVGAVVVVGAILWTSRDRDGEEVIREKTTGPITGLENDTEAIPEVRFTDITATAGVDFVHENGARGDRMLPETMGGGCAFLDYDGDGDQDLLLVNSTTWPWDDPVEPAATSTLYRNDGAGHFEDVTAGSGLTEPFYGTGVACGDYDGDGRVDLYLTAVGPNRLYRNTGGAFERVADAGTAGADDAWSTGAAFLDHDNDGDLDLFVCNYVAWSRAIDLELNYSLNGTDRAYGPPTSFGGSTPVLYRNDGGVFTDVSAAAGVRVSNPVTGLPAGKSLAVAPIDFNGDGFLDLFISNDTTQNFLFENLRDGTFREIGAPTGVAFDGTGRSTGAMGIDTAWFRNGGDLAVAIGNFANEMTSFYVKQAGSPQFSDDAILEGVGSPSRVVLSFGLFFFDYDLDGRLDLLQANGHLEEEINAIQSSQHYRQPAQLFWNQGPDAKSMFVEVPADAVGALSTPIVGRGAAYADIDGDGDLDVLLTQTGGRPMLLRNEQELGHHWLRVRLVGRDGNTGAIGARVELTIDGRTQRRQVMPTKSYLAQVELPVTFGLGAADRVDTLTVVWPDGTEQAVVVDAVDREIVVER